ncbi:C10 family peptidase [Prevotella communis]|uniref:C10 family peptidase n=1 Tax=Prevotella communis TaxID=2913614 RepID=UPI001EDB5EA4|nr:C10 family peptidase [Prevotella communis]UKK56285.1 C10 family peptidase [Prevotella communis]
MRKLLPILFLFVTVTSWAGNVTESEALQKAKAFIDSQRATQSQRQMRLAAKSTQVNKELTTATKESFYVFNVGQNDGYVVVSADDRTPAILGYADEGTFNRNDIPDNMKAWLQGYTYQLEYLATHANTRRAETAEHATIRPLIQSTWDQGSPYNNKCPMDGDKRSLTGCLATVMAQILNYYQYPEKTTSTIPSYTTGTKGITVNEIPVTTIDWSNIRNNYNGNETAAQKNAIATLMQLCGASMEMDYTSYSSYAYMIPALNAFKNYFDYDTSLRHVNRIEFKASEWDELIYNELAQKRPVYYCGQSIGGGHAFVIDGYSKDGLFHVNWGWGGSCNGYFLLSILDPHSNTGSGASSSSDGYSFDQDAIIGIQPNTDNKPEWGVRMTSEGLYTNLSVVNKQGSYFPISLTATFYNRTGATQDFDLGIGVYDKDNKEVSAQKMNDGRFAESWGYNGITYNCNIPALPDGTYAITAISREKGTDTWYQNSRSFQYYITATINGNQMTLQNPNC